MKIAHLVPTLHPNGPEIGLVDLAGAAHEADFELVVIALAATSDTTHVSDLTEDGERRGRMAEAARARFRAEYDAVGWARRLREVYDGVLARTTSRA